MIKLFNENSNNLNELKPDFLPIASHLINFISYWVSTNSGYGYEVVCTKRSWHSQKHITTIEDDRKNGLSWYLYGNAISINVFQKITDNIIDNESSTEYTKNTINFKDNSAVKFISDCQEWLINNPINGNIVKIFGVYPNIKSNINANILSLIEKHKDDPYVVYWGGLFNAGSNFSHWEWHPGYLPSDIYLVRQDFLNTAFDSLDLIEKIQIENVNGTIPTYLDDELEILEEDYLSIWNLKNKINISTSYNIPNLFKWAKSNPHSLKQAYVIYRLKGDYNNAQLFNILINEVNNYSFIDNELTGSGSISINENDMGYRYIKFDNEFSESIEYPFDTLFILPTDSLPDPENFDITTIKQQYESSSSTTANGTLTNVTESQVEKEISDISQNLTNPKFEVNEHGMLNDLVINPNKLITNKTDAEKYAKNLLTFEEMITPPIRSLYRSTKGIIDISNISNQKTIKNGSDEMISPPKQ